MVNAYQCFCTLMQDTKNTCALYDYLHQVVKPPYDYNDLLRWQWAQSVSALDKLIHDIVRIGMRESFSGNRPITDKFSNFAIIFPHTNSYSKINYLPLWFLNNMLPPKIRHCPSRSQIK